ncbi:hypothetical protein ACFPER_10245 [Agromyces aurantiacus]|uniref:Integral membrane protein n=1 Tax=Agromyces aurantiacus TaxID=165814 RepID=A0ABV9R7C9_9MICO|nr:hypothetical protein [Agromyces aurantiacus]MBM7503856.1 hypothetical protein [Agromyces aurantiacus]
MRAAPALFAAAAASYTVNCALGASVALRLVDTRDVRWVHHAVYIATCALAGAAASSALWGRPRGAARSAALALAPAAVPLAVIPYAGTRTTRHPLIALAAAPSFALAVIRSRR